MLIDSFIVTPKYKGKGISNILLAKNINEIINFNKDTYLYANENSLNLYKNFGFKAIKSSKIIEQRPQKKLLKFSL